MTRLNVIDNRPRATWTPRNPLEVLPLLRRNWGLLVLSAIAGLLAVLVALMALSPRYEVSAKLLVRMGREMTAPPTLAAKDAAQVMPAARRPEDAASEVEILTDPRLISQVVEHFGEDFFFAEPPARDLWQQIRRVPKKVLQAIQDGVRETMVILGLRPPTTRLQRATLVIGEALRIESVRKSDVIEIKLAMPDPSAGVLLLDKFIELAMENHVQAYRTAGAMDFFQAERAVRSRELRETEERLLARKAEQAAWSAGEQRSLLLKSEAEIRQQEAQSAVELAQTSAEAEHAREVLAKLPSETKLSSVQARNKATDELRTRIVQLQLELVSLGSRYTDDSPEIRDIRRQIASLRAAIDAEPFYYVDGVTTGANQQHEAVARDLIVKENLLQGQRARSQQISEQLAGVRKQLQAIEAAEIEIAGLERDVARLRRSLDLYDKGLEDARIAEAMDTVELSNLKVIVPPTAAILPSWPPVRLFLIGGFVGGLALGMGFAALREMRRRRSETGRALWEVPAFPASAYQPHPEPLAGDAPRA